MRLRDYSYADTQHVVSSMVHACKLSDKSPDVASYHDVSVKAMVLVEMLEAMITSDRMWGILSTVCLSGLIDHIS